MKGGTLSIAGSWRDVAVLSLLAAALIAAAWIVAVAAGSFEADPDYIYLLNGLELLGLHSPSYYTHPGTPVELMAAIVIALAWLGSLPLYGFAGVQDQLLAHPGFFMNCVNAAFVACNAAALVFFAARVRAASGKLFPAIMGALSIFLPMSAFLAIHRVSAEPVLLAGCLVLAGIVAPLGFGAYPQTKRLAIAVGAAIGFCIAAKATAAPLLLFIFLLRGKELRKMGFAACVVAAVILTLPVAPHYLEMALWYVALFTHQGGYGGGAVGVPGFAELTADAYALVLAMPETFVCLALYGLVLLARRLGIWRLPADPIRVLTFCAIVILIDLLLVLKQPEVRYTIPTVAFLGLGNAILARFLFESVPLQAVMVGALAVLGVWSGNGRIDRLLEIRGPKEALLRKIAASGCLLAPYYSVNLVQYNLQFGDDWTQDLFKDRLARLYPDFVSFDNGAGNFENFAGPLTDAAALALFARQKCVYLVGSPMARFDLFKIPQTSLSLVAQSPGGPQQAVAVYALGPGWNQGAKK